MGLGEKQEAFAEKLGKFIAWTYKQGYVLRLGEAHRPEATGQNTFWRAVCVRRRVGGAF